jgi:hypothetical protein
MEEFGERVISDFLAVNLRDPEPETAGAAS